MGCSGEAPPQHPQRVKQSSPSEQNQALIGRNSEHAHHHHHHHRRHPIPETERNADLVFSAPCVASGVSAVAGRVMLGSHEPVAVRACGGGVAAGNGDLVSSLLTGRGGQGRCEEVMGGVDVTVGRSWR